MTACQRLLRAGCWAMTMLNVQGVAVEPSRYSDWQEQAPRPLEYIVYNSGPMLLGQAGMQLVPPVCQLRRKGHGVMQPDCTLSFVLY